MADINNPTSDITLYDEQGNAVSVVQHADGKHALRVDLYSDDTLESDVIYKCEPVRLNGTGTKQMDVDGDPTPQEFRWEAPAGEVWYAERLMLLLIDAGSADADDFGSIGDLANGLQVNIKSKGTVYEYTNLQDNTDIVRCFRGSSPNVDADENFGFLDEDDVWIGYADFRRRIKLDGDAGDYIEYKVRDDLENIYYLQGGVHVFKVI